MILAFSWTHWNSSLQNLKRSTPEFSLKGKGYSRTFWITEVDCKPFHLVTYKSTEELNLAQKQNLAEIESLKKTVSEQRQELIDIRTARNKIRDDLDDEKRRFLELESRLQVSKENKLLFLKLFVVGYSWKRRTAYIFEKSGSESITRGWHRNPGTF